MACPLRPARPICEGAAAAQNQVKSLYIEALDGGRIEEKIFLEVPVQKRKLLHKGRPDIHGGKNRGKAVGKKNGGKNRRSRINFVQYLNRFFGAAILV